MLESFRKGKFEWEKKLINQTIKLEVKPTITCNLESNQNCLMNNIRDENLPSRIFFSWD